MSAPNRLFAAHVTSTAFHLSLSRSMIGVLVDIANSQDARVKSYSVMRALGLRDTWVGSARCLVDRGLIFSPDPEWPGRFNLTEAGEHVIALLQIAGLAEPIIQAIANEAAK